MTTFTYKTKGVCSRMMTFEIEQETIQSVSIDGGCAGNLLGISNILVNKTIDEVILSFKGVPCGVRKTSCPDQIAQALIQYKSSL